MQEKIYKMLLEESEITWQSIIQDLVNKEQMDPWNIDISGLTKRYSDRIKELKKHNFFISGKVLLAYSILLRLKSHKFLTEHISNFDSILYPPEEKEISELLEEQYGKIEYDEENIPKLLIKTPQERKRRITIKELMNALEKALDIDYNRGVRRRDYSVLRPAVLPTNILNITEIIKNIYNKILGFFKNNEEVTFSKLVPSQKKEDKLYTFLPLIYLETDGKIELEQEVPFGEIKIKKISEGKD